MTLEEAQEMFVGKRVRIKDATGKSSWRGEHDVVGILTFLGYNEWFPSWELCATIDRLPIQHVDLNKILLEPQQKRIFGEKEG